MPLFKIDDLQVWTGGQWTNLPKKYPEIKGFSVDSRNIPEGYAFVALIANRDGHDFIQDALNNGASAIIVSKELDIDAPMLRVDDTLKALQTIAKFHRLRFDSPVVGITGSCGKTTTKEFLNTLLSWRHPLCTKQNLNNEIGVALTLTQIDLRENQCAIIEAGVGAPNQMQELAQMIEPDIAIITCVAPAHMEKFVDISNIAKEKSVLAKNIAKDGWAIMHNNLLSWKTFEELECKKAIVAPAEAPEISGDLVFRYLLSEENGRVKVDMCIEGGKEYLFEIPVMTKGMQENALLAIAASLMLGTSEEQLAQKLETLSAGSMRGSVVDFEDSHYYVDCYNASPASMKDALRRFLKLSENSKRVFVIGDMAELGLASLRYHKEIGELLPFNDGDSAILVGRNVEIYKSAMLSKGWTEDSIKTFANASEASDFIKQSNAWIFVKASRVCELENALPQGVKDILSGIQNSQIKEEEIAEPEVLEETSKIDANQDEAEDFEDENFDESEDFEDDENDNQESDSETQDDEDERFLN